MYMNDTTINLVKALVVGFCAGGMFVNRPGNGIDMLSEGSAAFYAYVFLFIFLTVRWYIR